MLNFLSKVFKFMERWEYYRPSSFWFWTIIGCFCFTTFFSHSPSSVQTPSQAQLVIQEVRAGAQPEGARPWWKVFRKAKPSTTASKPEISKPEIPKSSYERVSFSQSSRNPGNGGKQRHEVINEIINYVDNLAKKKYFKEMQVKHFPDFESRASLEKQQAIIYHKAVKKIKEYKKISPLLNNYQKWLTAEEKSSIDYFHGTGIYAKFQDPKTPPNILDTRETFLKKMENRDMRKKFLETYNRVNPIE